MTVKLVSVAAVVFGDVIEPFEFIRLELNGKSPALLGASDDCP